MRAWPVHAVFALILVSSLVIRERASDVLAEHDDLVAAVLQVARSYGLAFREYTSVAETGRRALVFDAPACTRPIRIVLRSLTFDEEAFNELSLEPNYTRRYVYIDHVWDRPQRTAVWVQRVKYGALATIGQTRYTPSSNLLQIELPADCSVAEAIDWRMAWDRDVAATGNVAVSDPVGLLELLNGFRSTTDVRRGLLRHRIDIAPPTRSRLRLLRAVATRSACDQGLTVPPPIVRERRFRDERRCVRCALPHSSKTLAWLV
jgi:hypothetical protein